MPHEPTAPDASRGRSPAGPPTVEEQHELFLKNTLEYAIFMMDTEGRITTWNAGAERLFGHTSDEAIGRPGGIIFTEEDRANGRDEEELVTGAREGQASDERWHVRRDGSRFWGSGVLVALYAAGALRGYAKILRDNTRRREAEERFRALIDASAQIVWAADADGRVREDSPTWRAFTGQTHAHWTGGGWSDAVHPDDRPGAVAAWQHAVRTGRSYQNELRLRHVSGAWRWMQVRAVPLRDPAGAVRGWIGMNTDVTEERRAQDALRELTGSLEQRVVERTAQVRELTAALTLAEQEERRRIAQVLHDDLQQLLYAVQLKLGVLERDLQAGDYPRLGTGLRAAADLARESLTMTRHLTVGINPPILPSEGLATAFAWLAAHVEELYGLHVELRADEPARIAHPGMHVLLFQIVRELLFNVVKHADTPRARLELLHEADELVVHVVDGGRGFDAGAAARVGEMGSGLFSARERLGLFGGRLEVHSRPGEGTRCSVRIPLP